MSTTVFDTTRYYIAAELADLGGLWQAAGYHAVLCGSSAQYRDGSIRWYAAFSSRYKRSVCLHAFGDDGRERKRYVALDARLRLIADRDKP